MGKGGGLVDTSRKGSSGLFWTPEGIFIVATSDVLASGGKGNRRGTLIMVRHLNETMLEHIEKIISAKLTIQPLLKGKFHDIDQLLAKNGIAENPLNRDFPLEIIKVNK
jgi:sensor domain CHASE-containing protein